MLDLERAGKPQQATYVAYICSLRVVKMSAPLERVLRAFLEDPAAPRYGYDLMKAAGLKIGTLYPMLGLLEDDRLVTSAWETPQQDGQRPRSTTGSPARGSGWPGWSSRRSPPAARAHRAALPARSRGAWVRGDARCCASAST